MSELNFQNIEFEHDDFDFSDLEEELRVDKSCRSLLNSFYTDLLVRGLDKQVASDLAFCADYYLRDYLLDFSRQNVIRPKPGIIKSFAGNWFIARNLNPEFDALITHLKAVDELYRYLHIQHYISVEELEYLLFEAYQVEYYKMRIDSFLAINGDGFFEWDQECPLVTRSLINND